MFHISLALINMGEVCSVLKRNPLDLLDMIKEQLHCDLLCFVLRAVQQECRNLDLAE